MSLTHRTTTGILWNFAEQLGRKGIGLVATLLLAYFLLPADYGLVAMMAVFIAIASSLMDSGFKQALIRLHDASQVDFNTAFFANLTLGLLAYLLLFVTAPWVAEFYDEPRLERLIRVAGLIVVINAFVVVPSAILTRAMNFKAQLKIGLPAAFVSAAVAIAMAYAGYGVWALIAQMLVSALLLAVSIWLLKLWRPTLDISRSSLSGMYGFGYKLFLSGLIDNVFKNLYIIIIAKLFAASVAGLYLFAEKIKELLISQLVSSIQEVTYPALSTMLNDNVRLKSGYRKVIAVTTFLLFPAMLFLAALSQPLFEFLLPEKWWPAIVYLQLMAIAGVLHPLHAINLNILQVKGRSDLFLYLEIIKKTAALMILAVSFQFGVIGILVGQIVGSVLAYIPNSYFAAKLIGYSIREQISDFAPSLVTSILVASMTYGLQLWIDWLAAIELLVFGLAAGGIYLLAAYVFKLNAYQLSRELLASGMSGRKKI